MSGQVPDATTEDAPLSGKNDDPRRQRLLNHMRRPRGPVFARLGAVQGGNQATQPLDVQAALQGLTTRHFPQAPQLPNSPENIRAYNDAAAQAQRLFEAAERTLAAQPLMPQVAATQRPYRAASADVAAAVQRTDYVAAQGYLPAKVTAAQAVLDAKAKLAASTAQRQQVDAQTATYDEMAPVLADVKRSYVPQGMAAQIGQQKLPKDPHFQAYLSRLQELEDAKSGVDPSQPVAARLAATIKGACQEAVAAAQAYLAHHEKDLNDKQKSSEEGKLHKQYCEEGIKSASQYALAMDLDMAGRPTQTAPWDRETQMRVAGAQAAFAYEQGNKPLQTTKEEGGAGASASYWARTKSIDEVGAELASGNKDAKGTRAFIFKPADGEDPPAGMNDHQKGAGAAKEALASSNAKRFARQTGIDLGVPETTVVSMGQYALKGGDLSGPPLLGSAQQLAAGASTEIHGLPHDTFKRVKPVEVQKIALLDVMSLGMDRHGGNIMVDTADPGDPKLIPIDHGGTLPSRASFPTAKKRMGGVEANPRAHKASPVNVLLQIPAAFEPFDPEILAGLDLLDPAVMAADMKAQLATMDRVHPGLDAAQKVGGDSVNMSMRSMMFLKKAAKTLSPAEVQLALTQHGEALFDAPSEAQFNTLADQVIADAAPKKAAHQEVLGLTPNQLYDVIDFLQGKGWAEDWDAAEKMVMTEPQTALDLFKGNAINQAGAPPSPFDTPKGDGKQVITQAEIDTIHDTFPDYKANLGNQPASREQYAAFQAFTAIGTRADLDRIMNAVGGKPNPSPASGLAILQAWAELQTPAYQQERQAQMPLDASKSCLENLKGLMSGKIKQVQDAQRVTTAKTAATALDPTATASAYAGDLLTQAKSSLDQFFDPALTGRLIAEWQRISAELTQGPGQNQAPLAFAKEIEKEAQELVLAVTAAGLEDVGLARIPLAQQFQGLRAPEDALQNIKDFFIDLEGIKLAVAGAGNLWLARTALRKLQANAPKVLAVAVPIAPDVQTGPTTAVPQRPNTPAPTKAVAPLATFQWDPGAASAVQKQAVTLRLFKDRDTGMAAALKIVNKARDAANTVDARLSDKGRIAIYKDAEEACSTFSRFINGKLRGLSEDKSWGGYCDSAADEAEREFNRFKAQREALE